MNSDYHPLSKKQKAQLSQLARQAFNKLDDVGLVDAPGDSASARFTSWRHAEQAEAVGEASLTKCVQKDYLPLRAHFNSLLGRDDKAFSDLIKNQPANDHADPNDTPEERERRLHLIKQKIAGTRFQLGYVIGIARNKFRKPQLKDLLTLTTAELEQLVYTITNRVASDKKKAAK